MSNENPPIITVVGSVNIDFSVTADKLPHPGESVIGKEFMRAFGGKGANQAVGISRLAAIQATKLTQQLIPLCHAIPIEAVSIEFGWIETQSEKDVESLRCEATVRTSAKSTLIMPGRMMRSAIP